MNHSKAVRFINARIKQKPCSVEQATEIVLPMISNLLSYYCDHYKIYCPITGGRDSRVVLSFLRKGNFDFSCYTIRHPEHHDNSQDLIIPAELCDKNGIRYELIEDTVVSDQMKRDMDILLGKENYSQRTLCIAQTIKEYVGDGAIINGDIIGQVGKCSLHRDIPEVFATPAYFRCKLHNYSKGAKEQLKYWLEEIESSGEKVNSFDLFSIENRMGRWAGQENLIYNTIGQIYLNIFNCRSILYTWTAVSRAERKHAMLHEALLAKIYPALLDFSFGQDENIVFQISKSSGILYLLASFAKYYMEKTKYVKGK